MKIALIFKETSTYVMIASTCMLAGCSKQTLPDKHYQTIEQRFSGNDAIVEKPMNLSLNIDKRSSLTTNALINNFGKDTILLSGYKDFDFAAEAGKRYKITVGSLCDCLGFKKFIFLPLIEVTDPSGNLVYPGRPTEDVVVGPLEIRKQWVIHPNITGTQKIRVYADASVRNQKIGKFIYIVPASVRGDVVGDFNILIEEIK